MHPLDGHDSRLAREFGRKRWGDAGYAMEELVAELGSAFLCADLDLTPGNQGGPCRLYRLVAGSAQERQASDLQRGGASAEGG